MTYYKSLENWSYEYDLTCKGSFFIALFSMLYFANWAIASVIFPPLSDKYGRKKLVMYMVFENLTIYIIFLLLPRHHYWSVYVIMVGLFIMGNQAAIVGCVAFCYLNELAPTKYHTTLSTIWLVTEGITSIILAIYYDYITKRWEYIIIFYVCEGFFVLIFHFTFLPESPKWLYENQRYHECFKVLDSIASHPWKTS